MPIIARDNRKEFTPAPEGLHQAVCVDVVDLGLQDTPWGQKQKVEVRWQIEAENPETSKPFMVIQRYTLSLNEKSTLRHHLEAWRGRKFSKTELEGFDLEKLLDVNGQLQIVHNITDNGNTYSNVQAIVPLGKGMMKMRAKDYVRVKDRERPSDRTNGGGATEEGVDDDSIPF